ncbi:MAG: glycosyltransferase [Pirellulales bacterium]|nr:glycosyltransferase [Pirellulales bacterium]
MTCPGQSPRLSLVVPTHGRIDLLEKTLASIQAQTTSDFELIISDDTKAPPQQSRIAALVDSYTRSTGRLARYIFSDPGLGQAANTNQGLRHARGELVRILHSDDVLNPNGIGWEIAQFDHNPAMQLLFSDCIPFQSDDDLQFDRQPELRLVNAAEHFRACLSHQTALPSGVVMTREVLQRVGGMREDWRFLCDWEFFARLLLDLAQSNQYVGNATAGTYGWRVHPDSTTGRYWKDHFLEHQQLMEQWSQQLPRDGDLFVDEIDFGYFLQFGHCYRYERLWQDVSQLSPAEFRAAIPWLWNVSQQKPYRKIARKFARRHFKSRIKSLLRRRRVQRFAVPSSPQAPSLKDRRPPCDLVITPMYEDPGVKAATTIIAPYDNSLNLWSQRRQLATAKNLRVRHINYNRFYQRTLVEVLKHVQPDTEVTFSFHDNELLTWFGLKALLRHHFPDCFSLVSQNRSPAEGTQQGFSHWDLTYRCVQSVPAYYRDPLSGFTFGVLTMGNRNDQVQAMIDSIARHCHKDHEILLIVPQTIPQFVGQKNLRQIEFTVEDPYGWITRKKNILCQQARYSDIVICHDRFEFTQNFFDRFEDWGHSYGLAAARIVLPGGKRALDWGAVRGKNLSWCRGGLLNYRDYSAGSYVPGGITMIRKRFWETCRWDESLFWNEHEDVELCRRAQRNGQIIYQFPGQVTTATDRWVDENPVLPFNDRVDLGFIPEHEAA